MIAEPSRRLVAPLAALLLCFAACRTAHDATPGEKSGEEKALAGPRQPKAAPQGGQDNLAAQRARFLVQKYLKDARDLRIQGRLEEAKTLLLRAKELMPANQNVLRELAAVNAELGEPPGTAETYAEQMARLWKIREQRARARARDLIEAGKQAMEQGRYAEAIENFERVLLNIEYGKDVDWQDLPGQARELLDQARKEREERERERLARIERETQERLRAAEEERRARVQAQVERYLDTAMRAFDNKKFKIAEELAFQALQLDATNQVARNLHNAAIKARHETRTDAYYNQKRREFTRMLEEAEDLKIPQTDILRTDPTTWEIAKRRAKKLLPEQQMDPDDQAVWEQVRTKTVGKLSFTEETGDYNAVRRLVQTITGIPIIITPEAKKVIEDESLTLKMELVAPITVANFLDMMVGKSENLAWTVRNGVVEITTKAKAGGDNVLVSHDVRDLVFPMTNFLPPRIRDIPSGDTSAGSRIGGESDEKIAYVELDTLVANIKDATGGDTYWDAEGGGKIESVEGGYLLVTANPAMQKRVARFLDDMRRFATAVVTIESKFLTVTRNFLQEVGVDFRGLGGSGAKGSVATLDDITNKLDDNASRGLDNNGTTDAAGHPAAGAFFNDGGDGDIRARTENFFASNLGRALSPTGGATAAFTILDDTQLQILLRAVEKTQDVQVMNSQVLTVLNNERANVAVINQTSYIRDFDVEVAQAAFIADPKVDVIQDGIVLDVRPTITHDRKHVVLSLQPTVAELLRPIPTFTTSLSGQTTPVTLQLPQLTVKSFATTAQVPDGGSVLIGGLREVLQKERRAEVPVLSKIPVISFLFTQEGVVDENSSLMVLVRATITDVKDLMEGRK